MILEQDIKDGKYGDIEMSLKTRRVLFSVYKFLARITYKQQKTKQILSKHLSTFIDHLNDSREIPSHFLIQELFRNNKDLLFDPQLIQSLAKKIIISISRSQQNTYQRCHILYSLRVLVSYLGQPILKNQNIILYEIANKAYSNVLLNL